MFTNNSALLTITLLNKIVKAQKLQDNNFSNLKETMCYEEFYSLS